MNRIISSPQFSVVALLLAFVGFALILVSVFTGTDAILPIGILASFTSGGLFVLKRSQKDTNLAPTV